MNWARHDDGSYWAAGPTGAERYNVTPQRGRSARGHVDGWRVVLGGKALAVRSRLADAKTYAASHRAAFNHAR